MVLQDGSGHKAGRTVADTAKLDSCGHNGIVRPSPRRGPSAESVQVEPWVVQFANVTSFSLNAAEYLQGAITALEQCFKVFLRLKQWDLALSST